MARTYPTVETLWGGDISGKILDYARHKAAEQQLANRVRFQTMDALRVIEFPNGAFDLVNLRLGTSWLRTWEWKKLLVECRRVCRPGGTIRVTEGNIVIENNSPALTKLNAISLAAVSHSGRLFTHSGDGLINELERLMTQHCIEQVQTQTHILTFRAGTSEGHYFSEDMERFYRVAVPFFQKWVRLPDDYQQLYQQAKREMQQPDFFATWTFLIIWGIRPRDGQTLLMRGLL
jgi:ubiquinone/menaquinone biosynthesis C-methylase UbiE